MDTITLADLGIDEADDKGTAWHPRTKANAYTSEGLLPDLTDRETVEHQSKPEAWQQQDGVQRLAHPMSAEDSRDTDEDQV
jgi:hypothetical protein